MKGAITNSLRQYRKASGLTQKQVAEILGLRQSSLVSRWENGKCLPKCENLFRLELLYHTLADALYLELRNSIRTEIRTRKQKILESQGNSH